MVAPQYEGKNSDLIALGKKLTKEHPELGNQGSLSINYTGATFSSNQQEYAVFLLINKAGFQIDKDFEFSLSWKYDGQFIYQYQRIGYKISDSGALPDQSANIQRAKTNCREHDTRRKDVIRDVGFKSESVGER